MKKARNARRFPAPTVDQFLFVARKLHDCQSRCMLTFATPLDVDRLTKAIRLSLDVEPVLGCRFVEHAWKPFWEQWDDLDEISSCTIVQPRHLESECWQFLAEPMHPCDDPQIMAQIFRDRQDTLCIKLNHMVADAGGIIEYIGLLGRIYRELTHNATYRPSVVGYRSRGQGQVLRRVGIMPLLRGCSHYHLPASAWGFPVTGTDFSERTFAIRRLQPGWYQGMKTFCQKHRVSLNDVLMAAFYRALILSIDPPRSIGLPVQATINLRRYLPEGHAARICNLAGVFFPEIIPTSTASFEEILRQIHEVMEKAKDEQPWFGATLSLETTFSLGFSVGRTILDYLKVLKATPDKMHPFFANIGNITPQQVDFGDVQVVDMVMIGPVPYPPASMLSVNTFNGTMNITTGFCHSATDSGLVERFLDMYVAELPI
ncbi:MAG: hypothetical protein PHY29_04660 [Syntrophales bacterium]|nr:hypothetical protein [Syntrophales bacterium]